MKDRIEEYEMAGDPYSAAISGCVQLIHAALKNDGKMNETEAEILLSIKATILNDPMIGWPE